MGLPILTRHFFNSFCANFFAILYVSDDFSLFQVLQHFQCISLKNQQIVMAKICLKKLMKTLHSTNSPEFHINTCPKPGFNLLRGYLFYQNRVSDIPFCH